VFKRNFCKSVSTDIVNDSQQCYKTILVFLLIKYWKFDEGNSNNKYDVTVFDYEQQNLSIHKELCSPG